MESDRNGSRVRITIEIDDPTECEPPTCMRWLTWPHVIGLWVGMFVGTAGLKAAGSVLGLAAIMFGSVLGCYLLGGWIGRRLE